MGTKSDLILGSESETILGSEIGTKMVPRGFPQNLFVSTLRGPLVLKNIQAWARRFASLFRSCARAKVEHAWWAGGLSKDNMYNAFRATKTTKPPTSTARVIAEKPTCVKIQIAAVQSFPMQDG